MCPRVWVSLAGVVVDPGALDPQTQLLVLHAPTVVSDRGHCACGTRGGGAVPAQMGVLVSLSVLGETIGGPSFSVLSLNQTKSFLRNGRVHR